MGPHSKTPIVSLLESDDDEVSPIPTPMRLPKRSRPAKAAARKSIQESSRRGAAIDAVLDEEEERHVSFVNASPVPLRPALERAASPEIPSSSAIDAESPTQSLSPPVFVGPSPVVDPPVVDPPVVDPPVAPTLVHFQLCIDCFESIAVAAGVLKGKGVSLGEKREASEEAPLLRETKRARYNPRTEPRPSLRTEVRQNATQRAIAYNTARFLIFSYEGV